MRWQCASQALNFLDSIAFAWCYRRIEGNEMRYARTLTVTANGQRLMANG